MEVSYRFRKFFYRFKFTIVFFVLLMFPGVGSSQSLKPNEKPPVPDWGWSVSVRGGYEWRGEADTEQNGTVNAHRSNVEISTAYTPDAKKSISLSISYGQSVYDFSGNSGIAGLDPWDDIQSVRLGAFLRWLPNADWTLFLAPSLDVITENSADTDNALSGGVLAGFTYRFNDKLTLGPGVLIYSQIEDDPIIFPILLIRWQITDRLSFDTGGGLSATLGPGIGFNFRASPKWNFGLGGRFESLRFRLDDDGVAPDGVGEDTAMSIYATAAYQFTSMAGIGLFAGTNLDGELTLEDEDGNLIREEDYDPAPFAGLTFNIRF